MDRVRERERRRDIMKIRMDSIMPLCVIPFLRVETSEAGPLAIWEPNWLNQGREHNGVQGNRHSVYYQPAIKTKVRP